MTKISKNNYYSFLIAVECLKNPNASKEEKDKCTATILSTIKPYVAKR